MEEAALRLGVARHGQGKWKTIQEASLVLRRRSSVDCKDKWRNLCKLTGADRGKRRAAAGAGKPATQCVQTSLGRFYGQLAKSVNAGHIAGCSVDGTGGELGQTTKCEESEEGKCADVPAMVTPVTTAVAKVHSTPARGEEEGDEEDVSTSAQTAPVTPRTVPRQGRSACSLKGDEEGEEQGEHGGAAWIEDGQPGNGDVLWGRAWDIGKGCSSLQRPEQDQEKPERKHNNVRADGRESSGLFRSHGDRGSVQRLQEQEEEKQQSKERRRIQMETRNMLPASLRKHLTFLQQEQQNQQDLGLSRPAGGESSGLFRSHGDRGSVQRLQEHEEEKKRSKKRRRIQMDTRNMFSASLRKHLTFLQEQQNQQDLGQEHLQLTAPLWDYNHPVVGGGVGGSYAQGTHAMTRLGQAPMKGGDIVARPPTERSQCEHPSTDAEDVRAGGGHHTIDQAEGCRPAGHGQTENANPRTPAEISLLPELMTKDGATECKKTVAASHGEESMVGEAPDGAEASRMFRVHADRESWKEAQQEIWHFQHGEKEADKQQLLPHPTSLLPSCSPFPPPLLPPLHPLLDPRSSLLAPRSSLRAPSSSLARRAREIGGGRSIPQTLEQEHKKLERRHNPGKADGGEASRMFRVHADRESWKEAQQEIWRFQHGSKEADKQQLLQRQEEERTKQLRKRALERKLKAEHERKERARGQRLQGQKDEKQQNKMASYRHLAEELGESERNQRLQDSHRRLMERVRQEVKGRKEEILKRRQTKRDQRAAAEKRAIRWEQRLVMSVGCI